MEAKVYLQRYRLYVDAIGLPLVIRRSAGEATFKAQDLQEHKDVALQVVPVTALRTVVREQLEAEARAAQQITHINIPLLHDFGFEDGQIVYVTEYFDGTTADEWVKTHGPLPVGAALRVAQQVVNASSVATYHGIVHHAINPSNIMLVPGQTTEGEWPLIKLLNVVGVAPNLVPSENPDPQSADPINFASPEQMQTGTVDFRSQMYSLGATLWFLMTARAPLGGAAGVEHGGRVPSAVRRLLMQMLASDPAERPLDPLALQAAIRDCLGQLDRRDAVASKFGLPPLTSETAVAAPATTVARERRAWKPLALAAVLIAMAAIAAVVFAQHARSRQAIGVPVGVPDNVANASATAASPAASPIAQASNDNYVNTPAGAEPPVLTSNAQAPNENETQTTEDASRVAANESPVPAPTAVQPPTLPSPAQVVASNSPAPLPDSDEPPPPTEGPDEPAVAQTEPATQTTNTVARRETSTEPEKPATTERKTTREKTSRVAQRPNKHVRVAANADEQSRPLPRGSVRAQYLGTTPDGELVFGLPSNEKVYAIPPASARRQETPPPRRTRAIARPPDEELPVLPALPPDE